MTKEKLLELLNDLSVEEKVGELFQGNGSFFDSETFETGPASSQGFRKENVTLMGSILGIADAKKIQKIQKDHIENHPHHIPLIFMADIINGYRTVFPIPLAQGAAFDSDMAKCGAQIAAKEVSVSGVHLTFSPMVDLVRDARWGRVMESNGEDPYLNSCYAKALVEGYQGDDLKKKGNIAACVKHFAAYGAPVAGRDYNTVELSERSFREDYLPSYAAAVKAGAATVMTSFNVLNRIPNSANKALLRDLLRDELGFKGVVISDWAAIDEIRTHDVAEDQKEAAKLALEAGTDIDMMTTCYVNHLKELVEEGTIPMQLLDEAVLRVLELKNSLGLFENPYKDLSLDEEKTLLLCKEHRLLAKKAAQKTFVLLKNDNMLPLSDTDKVLFAGPYITEQNVIGSWSCFANAADARTIKEGILTLKPSAPIRFEKGCGIVNPGEKVLGFGAQFYNSDTWEEEDQMIQNAVEAAKGQDKVVLCLGEHMGHSGEGASRGELTITGRQLELLREVSKINSNITVLVFTGRPLDLREVCKYAKAVMVVWMPGTECGDAIAEVLYGNATPGGRLPMSFPYSVGQVPVYYAELHTGRHFKEEQMDNRFQSRYLDIPNRPLFSFGFGLSYTTFDIGKIQLSSDCLSSDKPILATVEVKNTGTREDTCVLQLYIRDDKGSVARPVKELKGFKRITLLPGESKTESFEINQDMLKFYDIHMDYVCEKGSFTLYIGDSSDTDNSASFCVL